MPLYFKSESFGFFWGTILKHMLLLYNLPPFFCWVSGHLSHPSLLLSQPLRFSGELAYIHWLSPEHCLQPPLASFHRKNRIGFLISLSLSLDIAMKCSWTSPYFRVRSPRVIRANWFWNWQDKSFWRRSSWAPVHFNDVFLLRERRVGASTPTLLPILLFRYWILKSFSNHKKIELFHWFELGITS